jgi:hypothetical protein
VTDLTRDDTERLLGRSREAPWTFPTSFGRPVDDQFEIDRLRQQLTLGSDTT